jgi:hypothetical protein
LGTKSCTEQNVADWQHFRRLLNSSHLRQHLPGISSTARLLVAVGALAHNARGASPWFVEYQQSACRGEAFFKLRGGNDAPKGSFSGAVSIAKGGKGQVDGRVAKL